MSTNPKTSKQEHQQQQLATRSAQALKDLSDILPGKPLANVSEVMTAFETLRGQVSRVNLISPLARVETLMPMSQVSFRIVFIDPTFDPRTGVGGEVYFSKSFCYQATDDEDPGLTEVALGKIAIQKLSAAAGVEIVSTEREDDRSDPNLCAIRYTLSVLDFDGTVRQESKVREVDLRDGRPDTMKPEWACKTHDNPDCRSCAKGGGRWVKTGRSVLLEQTALDDKRRHIVALADTKAHLRTLRALFSLKSKYSINELRKPFIIPKLVPDFDISDPQTKEALLAYHLGQTNILFGKPSAHAALGVALPDAVEPQAATEQAAATDIEAREVAEANRDESDEGGENGNDDYGDIVTAPVPKENFSPCQCEHGCQAPVKEVAAVITKERTGRVLCKPCYPGKDFDYETHKHLASLKLSKLPDVTPASVNAGNKARG